MDSRAVSYCRFVALTVFIRLALVIKLTQLWKDELVLCGFEVIRVLIHLFHILIKLHFNY